MPFFDEDYQSASMAFVGFYTGQMMGCHLSQFRTFCTSGLCLRMAKITAPDLGIGALMIRIGFGGIL